MVYKGFIIIKKEVRGISFYECKKLNLKAKTLTELITKINKKEGLKPSEIIDKKRKIYFNLNYNGREILDFFEKMREEKGFKSNQEVLEFLINLYEI
nr:hypothetical protein [uncultured Leptotrichia sp.]